MQNNQFVYISKYLENRHRGKKIKHFPSLENWFEKLKNLL